MAKGKGPKKRARPKAPKKAPKVSPERLTKAELRRAVSAGKLTLSAFEREINRRALKKSAPKTKKVKKKVAAKPKKKPWAPTQKAAFPELPRSTWKTEREAKKKAKAKPVKKKLPRKKRETDWQYRIRKGKARGLTKSQAGGRPTLGELSASVQVAWARGDLQAVKQGLPREIDRLVGSGGNTGMRVLREVMIDVLGAEGAIETRHVFSGIGLGKRCRKCGREKAEHAADRMGDLFGELGYPKRKGYNLFFSEFFPEVGWDY